MNSRRELLFEYYKILCGDYCEDWAVDQIVDEVLELEKQIEKLTIENQQLRATN